MSDANASDERWLVWIEVQKRIRVLVGSGDRSAALDEVNRFLEEEGAPDLRADALATRADLHDESGELAEAIQDLRLARAESKPLSYSRYTLELNLGAVVERAGNREEATQWYREAIQTAMGSGKTSAASAVERLLRIRAESTLAETDRALCEAAVQHAWGVLRQPGVPDLTQLAACARGLVIAQNRPVTRDGT